MKKKAYLLFCVAVLILSCENKEPVPMDLSQENLLPKPVELTATGSSFEITNRTDIIVNENDSSLLWLGNYLSDMLSSPTGFNPKVIQSGKSSKKGNIQLVLTDSENGLTEGYELEITENDISIKAGSYAGLFYGIQTLRQLLPSGIELNQQQTGPWLVASGSITDYPVYGYRGAMLDVARHFFEVNEVKRLIDYLALFKMNRLHLHLSDDQGWRLEIKSWPKLTTIGGSTEVGGGPGGFYTQEQYWDIVNYARERFITIVPEIDIPGHTNAALASYAELNCSGKATELYTGTKVGFSTLCTDKEVTYQFLDDVFRELASLTPGEYIHIGGDESHVTPLEDYIPFINKAQNIVEKHGKKVIGWDEIAHADLLPNTVVQWWAKEENAKRGIKKGAKVLISPAHKAYLDMQYDSTSQFGLHWAAYIEVDSGYLWDPATIAAGIDRDDIIGIEAPLWSETVSNLDEAEYLIFPRLPGYAEIGWSPREIRQWEDYQKRLGKQQDRFQKMGIDFYPSELVPWQPEDSTKVQIMN